MDFGMECLNSTIQHLRKPSIVRNIKDINASVSKVPSSATGGENFHITLCEGIGYF